MAQQGQAADEKNQVIITGSLIAGTPEDTALPVDVVDQEALDRRGGPTVMELIRTIPAAGPILGEANNINVNAQAIGGGGTTVNLRGLGPNRTLVLLNGRRLAATAGGVVDGNLLPLAAIGRVEVLKDGAAATYGSDAIGGVVNFITKKNFTGLELSADHSFIADSNGATNAGLTVGIGTDRLNWLISAGFEQRSGILNSDRDFSYVPFVKNPQGGWSGAGNPGVFRRVTATGATIAGSAATADPQCAALSSVSLTSATCSYTYTPYQNLIDPLERFQLFSSMDYEFSTALNFHSEVLYSHSDLRGKNSASNIPTAYPTGATLAPGVVAIPNFYYVPCNNPGLIDMFTKNPSFAAAVGGSGCTNATGAPANSYTVATSSWRIFGVGGNTRTGYANPTAAERGAYRVSAGFNGEILGGVNWDVTGSYMRIDNSGSGTDFLINRVQLALDGYGGAACPGPNSGVAPGTNGCLWFNPFSNAYAGNVYTGAQNPQYSAAVSNTLDLYNWLAVYSTGKSTNTLSVVDALVSGEVGGFKLPGGAIGWAAGAQYRFITFKTKPADVNNQNYYPCIDSSTNPNATCSPLRGMFNAGPGSKPVDLDQRVYAVFGELQLPILDNLNAQLAVRYEDYGGGIGSTTNPKLGVKWQVFDAFALRGSIGTTFRGPTLTDVDTTSPGNTLSPVAAAGSTSRTVTTIGNPNLSPETADSGNFGALLEVGPFRASLDYWRFDFKDPIVTAPYDAIATSVVPTPNGVANCSAPLRSQVVFDNGDACVQGTTTGANILRVLSSRINGPKTKVEGLDFDASLRFDIGPGELTLSGNGSYLLTYDVGATTYNGVPIAGAYKAAGWLNETRPQGSLPRYKGYYRADYALGKHSLGLAIRHTSSYKDDRAISTPTMFTATSPDGKVIDDRELLDFNYLLRQDNWSFTASVENIMDQDPPFARTAYSYDTFNGDPRGRTIKLGVRTKF